MSKAKPGVFDQIKQTQKQTNSKINLHIDPRRDPSRGKVDFLMGEAITMLNIILSGLSQESAFLRSLFEATNHKEANPFKLNFSTIQARDDR